jgi:D-hexose-6-phosphate mutarotase
MSDQQSDWISLHSDHLTVEINPLGAQLSTLRDRAGRDLLWNGDPSVWSGRAPLLFPIVGELAGGTYRVGSTSYSLPRHGFARGRRFALVDSSATHAIFRLQSDVTTLEIYPFRFQLDVTFEVTGATLAIVSRVRNLGTGDLLASFGYHPMDTPGPFISSSSLETSRRRSGGSTMPDCSRHNATQPPSRDAASSWTTRSFGTTPSSSMKSKAAP